MIIRNENLASATLQVRRQVANGFCYVWQPDEAGLPQAETQLGSRSALPPPVGALPCGRTHSNDVRSRRRRAIIIERQIKSYDSFIRHKR